MPLAIISRRLHYPAVGIQENIALKPLAIRIGIALLAAWYTFCRLFPTKRQIVCVSRQSNCPPVDFRLIRDYFQQKHPGWRVVILAHTLEPRCLPARHASPGVLHGHESRRRS